MTPTEPNDLRLHDLFVRYWDNALTTPEQEEFNAHLAANAQARELFHLFTFQAVAAGDRPVLEPVSHSSTSRDITPKPLPRVKVDPDAPATTTAAGTGVSRRRLMQFVGGGLAAGVGGAGLGWWLWTEKSEERVRLLSARGNVTVRTPDGESAPTDGPMPDRAVVATHGFGSSVVIAYPDGSTVSLVGDSVVNATAGGMELRLQQGAAAADIRQHAVGAPALSFATAQVLLRSLSGTLITLGQAARSTDIEVHQGQVSASALSGEALAVVRAGEMLTVEADGDLRKRKAIATPEEFAWDLGRPLPEGWVVGVRAATPEGPVVRPESWPDPYYNGMRMYQIRSDHQWMRGFFRLSLDSRIRVRYRAKTSGRGQVCFCVRTDQTQCPDTGMVEYNGGFAATGRQWRWLDVSAESMIGEPNAEGPKFGAPWIGFLVIVNTYEADLGLEIAEFRVTRPGGLPG